MTDSATVLAQCELLPHAGRVRLMIDLGKRLQADETVAATIRVLEQQSFYERYLALHACFGSGDGAHVLRALGDGSKVIRGLAIRLMAIVGTAQQVQQALVERPRLRLPLLWKLHQRGRNSEIDAFLLRTDIERDPSWWGILPFGSAAVVLAYQSELRQQASDDTWSLLAQFHPALMLDQLEQWSQAQIDDPELIRLLNQHMAMLVLTQSARVFALVQALLQQHELSSLAVEKLARSQPNARADLFIARDEPLPYGQRNLFTPLIRRLSDDQIVGLLQLNRDIFGYYASQWFTVLAPNRQRELFDRCSAFLLNRYGGLVGYLSAEVLETLPRERCESEARAIIANTQLDDRRFEYAYLLPWDEMHGVLGDLLHSPATEQRMLALRQHIANVRFRRDHLRDLLALLRERRMEADFMRRHIFTGLCTLPATLVQNDDLPDLTEIISFGLRDVGLSQETQQVMTQFLLGLLPVHSAWAIGQILTLLRQRGFAESTGTRPAIGSDVSEQLAEALAVMLADWYQQEKEEKICQALQYFLPDGRLPQSIVAILVTLLQETRSETVFQQIWQRLYAHDPTAAQDLLPTLLENDPSVVMFASIAQLLCYRRQDLVTPFLRYSRYAGRFARGRQLYLIPLTRTFAGGSTTQQRAYATALQTIVADQNADAATLTNAVRRLALLPAIAVQEIETLTLAANSLIRTTALFTLGRFDTQDGLPTVIAALQDSRARIAITVLRPFVQRMPPAEALALLRAAPMTRVTVAKEIVRLIAALEQPAALQVLLELEQQPLHRDVRLVLLNELWRYRAAPAVMSIFQRVALSPDVAEALIVCPTVNVRINTRWVVRRFGTDELQLVGLLLQHPEVEVVRRALNVCNNLEQQDDRGIILPHLLPLLSRTDATLRTSAFKAFVQLSTRNNFATIAELIGASIPNRELLSDRINALCQFDEEDRPEITTIARLALAELSADPMTVVLQIRLAIEFLPTTEFLLLLERLEHSGWLHLHALLNTKEYLLRHINGMKPATITLLEETLAQSADERVRYLALLVFEQQLERTDKRPPDYRARLQRYRSDPALLVASAAQFIFIDEEDGDE